MRKFINLTSHVFNQCFQLFEYHFYKTKTKNKNKKQKNPSMNLSLKDFFTV